MRAAAAADVDAELGFERPQSALQGADHAGGDARRVPVHPHHRAERLEPERVRQAAAELVAAEMMDDRLGNDGAERRHALAKPCRYPAAVERKVSAAGA